MYRTEHTLGLLYNAQRQPECNTMTPSFQDSLLASTRPAVQPAVQPAVSSNPPAVSHTQRSLHSFWSIPRGRSPAAPLPSSWLAIAESSPLTNAVRSTSTTCEDCSADLRAEGDNVMDVDGWEEGPSPDQLCGACGKAICGGCSVSNLGVERRCLACAGRQTWASTYHMSAI
jgi:hypothetical protein